MSKKNQYSNPNVTQLQCLKLNMNKIRLLPPIYLQMKQDSVKLESWNLLKNACPMPEFMRLEMTCKSADR